MKVVLRDLGGNGSAPRPEECGVRRVVLILTSLCATILNPMLKLLVSLGLESKF
jgi:hypothetical protein